MGKWSYNPTYRGYNTIYNWFLDQSCRLLLELGIELDQSWGSLLQFLMLNEVKWVHHVSHPCAIFPQKNKSINFTFNMGNDMIGMYFWNQNEILQPFTTWQPLQQNQKHNGDVWLQNGPLNHPLMGKTSIPTCDNEGENGPVENSTINSKVCQAGPIFVKIFDPLCSNPSCKWFWSGFWVPKHLLIGYLEH